MGFVASLRKSRQLRKISKLLGAPRAPGDMGGSLKFRNQREQALEQLLDLADQQDWMPDVRAEYGITREDLREVYKQLVAGGAGQWTRGHYVAASALVIPQTLIYLLEAKRRGVSALEIIFQLVEYFEEGKINAPPLPEGPPPKP